VDVEARGRIEARPSRLPVRPGITVTYLCAGVDRDARMQMSGGGGAENMFAAGEIMADDVPGKGYAAGMSSEKSRVRRRHAMRAADHSDETKWLMTICNSCRYCEELGAVFPAMELRHTLPRPTSIISPNLCHGCGACYVDCQFSPPHEFDVNVPRTLAEIRRRRIAPTHGRPFFARCTPATGWRSRR
jgi:hypothetical protein